MFQKQTLEIRQEVEICPTEEQIPHVHEIELNNTSDLIPSVKSVLKGFPLLADDLIQDFFVLPPEAFDGIYIDSASDVAALCAELTADIGALEWFDLEHIEKALTPQTSSYHECDDERGFE